MRGRMALVMDTRHMRETTQGVPDAARDRRVFWTLSGLYFALILLPILRADRYFNDDLVRVLDGNFGWSHNGRPLANLLMRALELGGQRLIDIAPLPQLLAGAALAWIGALTARRFDLRSPWLAALVVLPLGAQPFFLENLSYRFDALCMALAILFAALPVLIARPGFGRALLGMLALLASLCLYQPAITVFAVFVVLEAALALLHEGTTARAIVRVAALRAGQLLLAMLLYSWLFEPSIEGWVRDHGQVVSVGQSALVLDNAQRYAGFIWSAFNPRWRILFLAVALLAALLPTLALFWRSRRREPDARRRSVMARYALEPLLWLAALPAAVGPMLLLADPVMMPRVLVGVGALIAALFIRLAVVLRDQRWSPRWVMLLAGAWALGMVVMAAAFGNAAGAQRRYEDAIAVRLMDDLAELHATRSLRGHAALGSAGRAPVVEHAQRQFPLLRWLVPSYLHGGDYHSRNYLRHHITMRSAAFTEVPVPDGFDPDQCDRRADRTRQAYSIRIVDQVAVVRFNGDAPAGCEDDRAAR